MSDEIKISYTPSQTGVTADVTTPAGVLRQADIATVETPADSGIYLGDYPTINSGDLILAFHNSIYLGSEIYESKTVLVTTIADPDPAGGTTTDAVFDLVKGLSDDDSFFNSVITVRTVAGGDSDNRRIVDYVGGTTFRITVDSPFPFALSTGDYVTIWANAYDSFSGPSAAENATAVWAALKATNKNPGSMGQLQGLRGWRGSSH